MTDDYENALSFTFCQLENNNQLENIHPDNTLYFLGYQYENHHI